MTYHFKFAPEAIWFVAVAILTVLFESLLTFDPDHITDWRVWAVGILAACVRAAAGAALHVLGPSGDAS